MFVSLQRFTRVVSCKKCITMFVLVSKFAKFQEEGLNIYAFACVCMLYIWHTVRREICSVGSVSSMVFGDTSIQTDEST